MKAEVYSERHEEASGWKMHVVSYKLNERFYCTIDNVDPGARIARAEGDTRDEAESRALEKARRYLAQTKRHPLS